MNRSRALSTALGYVLTLGITAILVSGLLIAGGNFIEDQREQVIETELEVVGEQVASHINAADRLNQSGGADGTTVAIEQPFPGDVAGASYSLTLEGNESPHLRLETTRPQIVVEVGLTNTTALGQSSASGGDIVVRYDSDRDAVVIDNV